MAPKIRVCNLRQGKGTGQQVHVIHKPNGGLSSARNAALPLVRGEYVMFVDGDDRIEPECVEVMLDLLNKHGADVSVCNDAAFLLS